MSKGDLQVIGQQCNTGRLRQTNVTYPLVSTEEGDSAWSSVSNALYFLDAGAYRRIAPQRLHSIRGGRRCIQHKLCTVIAASGGQAAKRRELAPLHAVQ